MPRPAATPRTPVFDAMQSAANAHGETNDCAVKAVAIACNADYDVVHAMMRDMGRVQGKGTPWQVIYDTIDRLGYERVRVNERGVISKYPKGHRDVLKNITTHHPDRFPAAWADGKTYLMVTNRHILAIVNGVNHDWTRGTARRCLTLWEVRRK